MKIRNRMPLWRRVTRVMGARLFHWAENNGDASMVRNGEKWLVDSLTTRWGLDPQRGPRIVLDVGANVGGYSAAILSAADRHSAEVKIYAFEPGTKTCTALRRRFASDGRVNVISSAIGEHAGQRHLYSDTPLSTKASLYNRSNDQRTVEGEMVEVVRLDEFLRTHVVNRVDFLKLDVEGAELGALVSLGNALRPDTVEIIQFEYGGTTLDAGVRLRDFFKLLEEKGYVIAKLLPHSLVIRRYFEWMDHFSYANYVAFPTSMIGSTTVEIIR